MRLFIVGLLICAGIMTLSAAIIAFGVMIVNACKAHYYER